MESILDAAQAEQKNMIAGQIAKARANARPFREAQAVRSKAALENKMNNLNARLGIERGTGGLFAAGQGTGGGFMGAVNKVRGSVAGAAYKTLYPEKYAKLTESVLSHNKGFLRQQMQGAGILGNKAALAGASEAFGATMRTGQGRFGLSMSTRLMGSMNWSATKAAGRGAMMGVGAANMASKAVLGASLGQVGFAAAAVAGLGYMAGSALGITGQQVSDAAGAVHETMKQASKPQYGYSELGQSTQGLTFGLHNKRRG